MAQIAQYDHVMYTDREMGVVISDPRPGPTGPVVTVQWDDPEYFPTAALVRNLTRFGRARHLTIHAPGKPEHGTKKEI